MRALVLAAVLTLPALAGCVTQSLQPAASPAPGALHVVRDVLPFTADAAGGAPLVGSVYLPDGPG
ncbi:MAG: hypothetical protein LC624_03085, partial [Halobacteriales archaeon]|nr:hypothetical protein [Halobacteriales archaeon]